jgi:tetratricopeptide (TPR) repeat protein
VKHRFSAALLVLFAAFTLTAPFQAAAQPVPLDNDSDEALEAMAPEERGDLLMVRHAYVEAAYAYSLAPMNATLWNKTGIAWHHLLAIGEARRDYEKALRLKPDYPDALNNLGATYFAERNYRRAVTLYQRALNLEPKSAVFTANLGTAYFAMGKAKEGAAAYRAAFALDPQIFDATAPQMVQAPTSSLERARLDFCLAELFAISKEPDQALAYLSKAIGEGYVDRKRLMQDEAFAEVRGTPEFAEFLAEAGAR